MKITDLNIYTCMNMRPCYTYHELSRLNNLILHKVVFSDWPFTLVSTCRSSALSISSDVSPFKEYFGCGIARVKLKRAEHTKRARNSFIISNLKNTCTVLVAFWQLVKEISIIAAVAWGTMSGLIYRLQLSLSHSNKLRLQLNTVLVILL